MMHPPVQTDATRRAEEAGRALLTRLVRDGRTNIEIARTLRVGRNRLIPVLNEIRTELAELGERHLRPVDLDKLQGACRR